MTTATDMLSKYIAAETAILSGQIVHFRNEAGGQRTLTLANLAEVQQGRRDWERRVNAESRIASGGTSPRYQTPDFS